MDSVWMDNWEKNIKQDCVGLVDTVLAPLVNVTLEAKTVFVVMVVLGKIVTMAVIANQDYLVKIIIVLLP